MSHRLQVLIPKPLDAQIRKAAERRRMSKGAWVRQAIEAFLRDERGETDALQKLAALNGPTSDIDEMLGEIESGRG